MRSYEESCAMVDRIVGRCIREADFASATLADPDTALRDYHLNKGELSDFQVLHAEHREEAGQIWATIRNRMEALRSTSGTE